MDIKPFKHGEEGTHYRGSGAGLAEVPRRDDGLDRPGSMDKDRIICGDSLEVLKTLPDESVDCCITSPPYWNLRDYKIDGQIGLEEKPEDYVWRLIEVFDEVKRVLKRKGTCWVDIKDTYYGGGRNQGGLKPHPKAKRGLGYLGNFVKAPKGNGMAQIPSQLSLAMAGRNWILWNEIIWRKPNAMPESVKRRFTNDFEKIYLFSKNRNYYFEQQLEPSSNKSEMDYRRVLRRKNAEFYKMKKPYENNFPKSFREDGNRNMRTVWDIPTKPFLGEHEASFPEDLIMPMVKAGCPEGGVCLDPFMGAGTTAVVAKKLGRHYIGIELNPAYVKMAEKRIGQILIW